VTLPIEPYFFGEFSVQVVVSGSKNPESLGFFPEPKRAKPTNTNPFTKIQEPFSKIPKSS